MVTAPGEREAERLRAIIQTLSEVQPHMQMKDAAKTIFEIEARTAKLEVQTTPVPASTAAADISSWIDSTVDPTVREFLIEHMRVGGRGSHKIWAIKEIRTRHPSSPDLVSAKLGAEYWLHANRGI